MTTEPVLFRRSRSLATAAVLSTLSAFAIAAVATEATASPGRPAAPVQAAAVTLTPLDTYTTGAFDEGASEIVSFDPATARAFVVNALDGTVDILDLSDPTNISLIATLDTPGANSVDMHEGIAAVGQQADNTQAPGTVSFFDTTTGDLLGSVEAGALPDMVTFTPDGSRVLVANEGEPSSYCADGVDPQGSISVIDLRNGVEAATVSTAGFTAWDGREDELREAGVRIFGPGAWRART